MSDNAGGGFYYPFGPDPALRTALWPRHVTSKNGLDPTCLDRPITILRGVGRRTEQRLLALGIHSVGDLLLYLPFRHEEPSRFLRICDLPFGEEVVVRGRVVTCTKRDTLRRRTSVLEALVTDDSGGVVAVWYNQAYLESAFAERPEILLRGTLKRQRGVPRFLVRRHELLGDNGLSRHILGLIPVYPATADLSVRAIRALLHEAAQYARHLSDPLPARLLARRHYPGKAAAVLSSHFPRSLKEAAKARERLAFEELILLQLAVLERRRAQETRSRAVALGDSGSLCERFLTSLSYQPTSAQGRVLLEIDRDLARTVPMRRLLHGDVGSGKTMIAAYCLLRAVEQGGQGVLMAPTEVLADQHFINLSAELGRHRVSVGQLKGSQTAATRRAVLSDLASGDLDLVVGTQALIQGGIAFRDLRVVVVDEQHRFGVNQREAIRVGEEEGLRPHALHMSATPIPRTLSLTLYGDLDVSVLDEVPAGRRPIQTQVVFPSTIERMWGLVRRSLDEGRQAYVVCPLIEESDALEAASARRTFEDLTAGQLSGYRLRLLHGQLSSGEKTAAMKGFVDGDVDVLVSTSVIEVGVDVANATDMVIFGARRFGLSQLHQLRGRVGRGLLPSRCFVVADSEDETALERLGMFAKTADGFVLAEADLRARGEGQLFGDRQSGLGDLEVASLLRDGRLLEEARRDAETLLAEGRTPITAPVFDAAAGRFGSRIESMERL